MLFVQLTALDDNYIPINDDDDMEEDVEEPNDLIDKKLSCHFKIVIQRIYFNSP